MKEITATYLARNLSDVMDEVERTGESFVVTRGGRRVASIGKPPRAENNVAQFLAFLRENPPDEEWLDDIMETRRLLYLEERE